MFTRHPLLLALLCLVAGITVAGFIPLSKIEAIWAATFSFILLGILLFFKATRTRFLFGLLFCVVGFASTAIQDTRFNALHFSHQTPQNQYYLAVVLAEPTHTKKALRLEIELKGSGHENQHISGKTFLYTPPDSVLEKLLPGDEILFKAKINPSTPPLNPYEFDYQNYLHLHHIYGQAYAAGVKRVKKGPQSFHRLMATWRTQLFGYIRAMHLQPEEEAVAAALLLGYRHLLSDDTQQAFSGAGAMHVLAVSGLHVGILYMITAFLLQMDKRKAHRNSWPKVLLVITIIWLYAALTGLSPSVSRAAVMFTFIALGNLFWRKPAIIQMIIFSAIFLLGYNPNYLFEVGFQLSYSAVFAIVYLQPNIYRLIKKPKHILVDKTWQITTVSIAAQAGTFPLSLYYFHQFPVFFMVSNLIVIPLAYVLMNLGILLLLLSAIATPPTFLISLFQMILSWMTGSVHIVESLPGAVLTGLHIGRIEMALLTLLVYFFAEAFFLKKKWALFSSAVLAICLLLSFSGDAFQRHDEQSITIYSIPSKTAIEIRKGRNAVLIADEELLADDDAMLFYIRHNLWAEDVKQVEEFSLVNTSSSKIHHQEEGFIDAFGERILLYQKPSDSLKFELKPSYILVSNRIKPPSNIPKDIHIILINGRNSNTRNLWQELPNALYDLSKSGALEIVQNVYEEKDD